MASNSPGMYSRSLHDQYSEESDMISGLLQDATDSPGKFLLSVTSGFQRDVSFGMKDSGYYVSTSDGASTCSSGTAETCDLEGGALLVLETKSLRTFTTNDEYLYAMKEDLADWFSSLYQNVDITADNLLKVLETGVLLCKHANKVQEFARQHRELGNILEMRSYFIRSVPEGNVPYREEVKPETFQARDNVSNFISWTRQLGIPEVLSFETDDLVLRKNEKSVILSLLEVARIGAKLGMLAPTLVQMEQEIDAELAGEEPPRPQVQIKTCDLRSLDERVRDLIGRCTCPVQFPMIKVGEGKYKIGDTRSLIFVRILRNHVMVRVGGGWDTLENYLNKHDPCQCHYRGHRSSSTGVAHNVAVSQQRKPSITNNATLTPSDNISSSPKRVSPAVTTSRNRPASPKTSSRANSPIAVISGHIQTPPTSSGSPINSVKGVRVRPRQKQQEVSREAWSRNSSKSSSTSSASHLIRPNSPSMGRHKSNAPPTKSQTIITQNSPSRTPSSPGVIKGRLHLEGKSVTPRKDSLRTSNSATKEDYPVADNDAYVTEDDKSDNLCVRGEIPQLGSASFEGQTDLYRLNQSSSLEQTCVSDPISFVEGKVMVNLRSDRINNITLSKRKDKQQQVHSEQHDEMSSSQTINPDSAQAMNLQELSKITTTQAISKILVEPCSNMLQIVNDNAEKDKNIEVFDTVANQVEVLACTIRDRPTKISHIPKPSNTYHLETQKSYSSVSNYSTKDDIGMFNPQLQVDSSQYQINVNSASMNKPLVLSKSSSNSSSVKSLDVSLLSSSSTINNSQCSTPAVSQTQARSLSNVSDNSNNNRSNNAHHKNLFLGRKDAIPATSVKSPTKKTHMTGTHEKLPVGKGVFSSGNIYVAPYSRNSTMSTVRQKNTTLLTPASLLHHTSDLETEQVTNEITFSDDEEINEIFKSSALKEETPKNVHSSGTKTRQTLQNNKKSEEVLLINRDRSGHHTVQQVNKNDLKHDSTPKSRVMHRPHSWASSNASSAPGQSVSRSSSKTSDVKLLKKKIAPVIKNNGGKITKKNTLNESAGSFSDHRSNSKNRTEAFAGSVLSVNKRKSHCQLQQAQDLENETLGSEEPPGSLEEMQVILTETKNDSIHAEDGLLHPSKEDSEMYKKMEKLFQEYKEMELRASVKDTSGKRSELTPHDTDNDSQESVP